MRERCNCEHASHFADNDFGIPKTGHDHMAVPAGDSQAQWIGAICDDCAATCMSDYLV